MKLRELSICVKCKEVLTVEQIICPTCESDLEHHIILTALLSVKPIEDFLQLTIEKRGIDENKKSIKKRSHKPR